MPRIIRWILVLFVVVPLVLALLVWGLGIYWSHTPHGRIDVKLALMLKFVGGDGSQPPTIKIRRVRSNGSMIAAQGDKQALKSVRDLKIPVGKTTIPGRLYIPKGKSMPKMLVVYYHGGGWAVGNLNTHDNICRQLAHRLPAQVLSVGYRLAPEHKFPQGLEDNYAALQWAATKAKAWRFDPARIIVAGDSAGGNFAAVVSILARDRKGHRPWRQVLIYPKVDVSRLDRESYKQFGKGYLLDKADVETYRRYYVHNEKDWLNPYVSPLLSQNLSQLPPAFVITAKFDVLRDEGTAYAEALRAAKVPTLHYEYTKMTHGFIQIDRVLPQAIDAIDRIAAYLKQPAIKATQPR